MSKRLKEKIDEQDRTIEMLKAENERFKISDEHNRNLIDRLEEDLKIVKENNFFQSNEIEYQDSENDLLKRSLNDKDKIIELMQINRNLEDRPVEVCDE